MNWVKYYEQDGKVHLAPVDVVSGAHLILGEQGEVVALTIHLGAPDRPINVDAKLIPGVIGVLGMGEALGGDVVGPAPTAKVPASRKHK